MKEDRISHLPREILDNILSRLPIQSAVSTTILSTKWRDRWIHISNLVFDYHSIDDRFSNSDKLARVVNHVMLAHRGTIDTFSFKTRSSFHDADMDNWISLLRKSRVKDLICEFSMRYTLPLCLFSFAFLRHLSLTNCISPLPHKFTAFKGLVTLELKKFRAFDDEYCDRAVQTIIDNCPVLEKLVLSEICFNSMDLHAVPNLKCVYVEGEFKSVNLENSPQLRDASFKMTTEAEAEAETEMLLSYKLQQLPSWLSLIRKLALSGYFLRCLAARCVWRGINIGCDKVEVIELDALHFDELEEMSLAFSIIVSSSNLKELHIKGTGAVKKEFGEFAEGVAQVSSCFKKLVNVKMKITRYEEKDNKEKSYLKMIKLIAGNSPVLEKMEVHYIHSEKSDSWFKKKLFGCKTASSRLKLVYSSAHVPYQLPRQVNVHDDNYTDWSLGVNYGYW